MNYAGINIVGRLAQDIEVRTTQSGGYWATFSVAVNHGRDDKKTTTFFSCKSFGERVRNWPKWGSKGDLVFVSGRPEEESWQAKDGGGKRTKFVVFAYEVKFLSPRKEGKEEIAEEAPF